MMRAVLLLLLAASCGDDGRDAILGGERIPAERLERGRRLYVRYCATCHGERGDGLGPSSAFQWPPPR
ncbi:MAG TPA: c-type cytochrome, partial [Kofleriaceae bacterium]|nr:c-type cytochrome [Kofleriaceae bacterium]